MPITITPAPPAGVVGPGIPIDFSSDFIGPLPSNTVWDVAINTDAEGAFTYYRVLIPFDGKQLFWVPMQDLDENVLTTFAQPAHASQVYVSAQINVGGTIVDSGTVQKQFDATTGLAPLQRAWSQRIQAGGEGGLTPPQAAQLTDIWDWVQRVFTYGVSSLVSTPLGALITHPPVESLGLSPEVDFWSGRGAATHPGPIGPVSAYGLSLELWESPPVLGFKDGWVQEYEVRLIQVATTHLTANGSVEYVSELLDLNVNRTVWLWRNFAPNRILYDVAPGVTIRAQWLFLF